MLIRNSETLERNYKNLKKYGLTNKKIASQAVLLGLNSRTFERNYRNCISLIRQDHQNRLSGKNLLLNQPQLLVSSPNTIKSNIQFFYHHNINYSSGIMLGTTVQNKRKKLAWILREVFDYKDIPKEKKKQTINSLYGFVRKDPILLAKSISTLEKSKEKLKEKVRDYLKK